MLSERFGPRAPVRALLAIGILAGGVHLVETALGDGFQLTLASDVYYHATREALEGGAVYDVAPPGRAGYHYLYPPIALVLFLPHALLGSETGAYVLQTGINLVVATGLGLVIVRAIERRGIDLERVDRVLLVGFVVGSSWTTSQLVQGQVNLWLALGFALGFVAMERARGSGSGRPNAPASTGAGASTNGERPWESLAGVAFGLAALVKVFPAAIGLWLLRLRSWRAVAAATATGLAGLAAGALAFGPDLTVTYLTEVLTGRYESASFQGAPDPERTLTTARRQVGALLGLDGTARAVATGALLAPFLAACHLRVDTDEGVLVAALGTVLVILLFLPLQALYFPLLLYPLLVLYYVLPVGRPRTLLLAGVPFTLGQPNVAIVEGAVAPLPGVLAGPVVGGAETLFEVIQTPTIGMWLLLVGCGVVQLAGRRPEGGDRPARH